MNFEDLEPLKRRLSLRDWEIIRDTAQGQYVEVGTYHGASAAAAAINADSVISIDIYDWQPKVGDSNRIIYFKGTSVDYVTTLAGKEPFIDVFFLDGSHEYDYVLKDCETLIPLVKPGGFILFHDCPACNPHGGVSMAVEQYLKDLSYKRFKIEEGTSGLLKIQKLG